MCGRDTEAKDFWELVKLIGLADRLGDGAPAVLRAAVQHCAHAIGTSFFREQQPTARLMRWGLIPSWAKDVSVGNALINARSETLGTWAAFREAFLLPVASDGLLF